MADRDWVYIILGGLNITGMGSQSLGTNILFKVEAGSNFTVTPISSPKVSLEPNGRVWTQNGLGKQEKVYY